VTAFHWVPQLCSFHEEKEAKVFGISTSLQVTSIRFPGGNHSRNSLSLAGHRRVRPARQFGILMPTNSPRTGIAPVCVEIGNGPWDVERRTTVPHGEECAVNLH
jgi:hypothetical protein